MSLRERFGTLRVLDFTGSLVQYEKGISIMETIAESIRRATPLGRKNGEEKDAQHCATSSANARQAITCQTSDNDSTDTLILLQHFPVFTLGKRGHLDDFKIPEEELRRRLKATVARVGRGGEVTYHGPGQVVAYPVVSLRRRNVGPRAFVEGLEDVIVATAANWGVRAAGRVPGKTGVWVDEQRKLAAIGVQIRHGVSTHGLALNVRTDLSHFDVIVPCGIADKEVTSIEREIACFPTDVMKGMSPPVDDAPQVSEASKTLVEKFQRHFLYETVISAEESERNAWLESSK